MTVPAMPTLTGAVMSSFTTVSIRQGDGTHIR